MLKVATDSLSKFFRQFTIEPSFGCTLMYMPSYCPTSKCGTSGAKPWQAIDHLPMKAAHHVEVQWLSPRRAIITGSCRGDNILADAAVVANSSTLTNVHALLSVHYRRDGIHYNPPSQRTTASSKLGCGLVQVHQSGQF